MSIRSGTVTTIFVGIFCIFIGLGVLWYFIRGATTDVSTLFVDMYPYGVYDANNLTTLNIMLFTIPFFGILSLIFFTYISIKRRNKM